MRCPPSALLIDLKASQVDALDRSEEEIKVVWFPHHFGFTQWAFWGRRSSSALRHVILHIATTFLDFARAQNIHSSDSLSRLAIVDSDVLKLTGPGAITEAMASYWRHSNPDFLSSLDEPKTVGSIIVLPMSYWAADGWPRVEDEAKRAERSFDHL